MYDALTQRRQYKEGYKQSKAIDIMLEDCKKGKMSAKFLRYLLSSLLKEVDGRIQEHTHNVIQLKEELATLHDLETVYKSIYELL